MRWKYFLVFCVLFLLLSPAFSESSEEFTVPDLIPTEEYVMMGQDIMTLYQTINNLSGMKNEYKTTSQNALKLAKEYEKENQQLVLQNNFLVGTTVVSVGVVVAGVITLVVMNIN